MIAPARASTAATVAIAILALASAAAAAGLLSKSTSGIKARHGTHALEQGIDCERCHAAASVSKKASDLLLPSHEACLECHPEATCEGEIAASCKACHKGEPTTLLTKSFEHAAKVAIAFDHSVHVPLRKKGCRGCHETSKKNPDTRNPSLPGMQLCIGCHPHDDAYDTDSCAPCHIAGESGVLTHAPGGKVLSPPAWMHGASHDDSWVFDHGPSAATRPLFCSACHTDADCASCHAGKAKPAAIHPGDWMDFHPVAATMGGLRCTSCHGSQEFCLSCHQKAGVSWSSPTGLGVPSGDVFHPEGWYSLGGQGKHGKEARKNLGTCVSCHMESDCTMCHSAESTFSVSPHPGAGTWLEKCGSLAKKSPHTCLVCHPAIPLACK